MNKTYRLYLNNKSNLISVVASLGLLSLTALSGAILLSSNVNADNDSVVDEINITVPISCSLSGSGMTSHTTSIPNGTYTPDIGTTTLTAFCNDGSGFSIYAAGYTGNEIGATNSNKLVGTSASNNSTISTGTATGPVSGNDNSNWAMKLTAVSNPTPAYPITISTGFDSYHAVPNEYTKVATRLSGTDTGQNTEGSSLTTTYAAYISKIQPADTYSGQVIYTLVHPSSAPAPVVCNPSGTTISTIKCMQDISSTNKSSILSSMTSEQQYTLKDKRDGKEYTIAKLLDGNIWMTQNLDLDLDSSKTYTNLDTDIGYNSSTGQYDTATWTPIRSTYTTGDTTWCEGGTLESWDDSCKSNFTPESYNPGDLYWSGNYDRDAYEETCRGNWENCDESLNPEALSPTGNVHYHLGNYYNWPAAVAKNDTSEYLEVESDQWIDTNQSICPTGWMLPKNIKDFNNPPNGSFYYLASYYGWDDENRFVSYPWDNPLYITFSGDREGIYLIGSSANFHISEVYAYQGGFYEEYNTVIDQPANGRAEAWPSDHDFSARGGSIRCVAR